MDTNSQDLSSHRESEEGHHSNEPQQNCEPDTDTGFVGTVTIDIVLRGQTVFFPRPHTKEKKRYGHTRLEKCTLYYQELQCITDISAFRLKGSRHCMVHTHVIHLKNH